MSDEIIYWDRVARIKDLSAIEPPIKKGVVLIPLGQDEFDMYVPNRDGEFMIVSRFGEVNAVKRPIRQ